MVNTFVVDVGGPAPGVGVGVRKARDWFDDAGVVDQNIQATERFLTVGHGGGDIVITADIATHGFGPAPGLPDFSRDRLSFTFRARRQYDIDAKTGEFPRGGGANALAGAGNQRCLVLELLHQAPLPR